MSYQKLRIQVRLNQQKTVNGKHPLYIRIYVDGSKAEIATQHYLAIKDWNRKKQTEIQLPYSIIDGIKHYNFSKSWNYLQQMGKLRFGQNFKLHPEDKLIIYKLLIYFIRDEETCAQYGIDLEKGILLNGPVGCGKTSLMTLMRHFAYPGHNFIMKTTREIASEFNQEGYPVIQKYGKTSNKIYCFDDLGVENNMKYFGNECNTIAEIILQRYDLQIMEGTITHATTNLIASELEELYGNRVRSRLRSMFNLITFDRESCDKRV